MVSSSRVALRRSSLCKGSSGHFLTVGQEPASCSCGLSPLFHSCNREWRARREFHTHIWSWNSWRQLPRCCCCLDCGRRSRVRSSLSRSWVSPCRIRKIRGHRFNSRFSAPRSRCLDRGDGRSMLASSGASTSLFRSPDYHEGVSATPPKRGVASQHDLGGRASLHRGL